MSTHAILSASGSHRWLTCNGSLVMEDGLPDNGNEYSREGTAAHEIAARALDERVPVRKFLNFKTEAGVLVDLDMVTHVQGFVDYVRKLANGKELFVETRVNYAKYLGVPEETAFGTSDVIILDSNTIHTIDLKFGAGYVVEADENPQLLLYGLGSLNEYGHMGDFDTLQATIYQPRREHISTWDAPLNWVLVNFVERARAAAQRALTLLAEHTRATLPIESLNPSEEACRFCKARATCPAAFRAVAEATRLDFEVIETESSPAPPPVEVTVPELARLMSKVELVRGWCDAIEDAVQKALEMGVAVPGYKLVEGKRGARSWVDEKAAEKALKKLRIAKQKMYQTKLISPTTAETLLSKAKPKVWQSMQHMIVQQPGKPKAVPESDKRPALAAPGEFDDLV